MSDLIKMGIWSALEMESPLLSRDFLRSDRMTILMWSGKTLISKGVGGFFCPKQVRISGASRPQCKGGRPAGGSRMWADVQKGCGMGLGGYAYLCVPSFVHTTLHTMHTILHTIFGHSVQLKS